MSRKSNINMDHYKTKGRGRPGETVVHDDYKRSHAGSRLERIKRSRKRRGLSARQLCERKLSQRTVVNPDRQMGDTRATSGVAKEPSNF